MGSDEIRLELRRTGAIQGEVYVAFNYKLYEAFGAEDGDDSEVLLLMWLHGADMGDIAPSDLIALRRRLRRKTFFFVPACPTPTPEGRTFNWGLSFTKSQSKGGLGFIFGEPCEELLEDLNGCIVALQREVSATSVFAMGYSMGGLGVYQLAAHSPHLFDGVVVVAGYGQGTLDTTGNYKNAPPLESAAIFKAWCARLCPRIAQVGALLVVHAPSDIESSFQDAQAIVAAIREAGGVVQLVEVPDDKANSDKKKNKRSKKSGHSYFNYTLIRESAEEVVFKRLDALLQGLEPMDVADN